MRLDFSLVGFCPDGFGVFYNDNLFSHATLKSDFIVFGFK